MGIYFGTDGIRGIVNNFLTCELAYKCGNAIGASKHKSKIIIGGDTRTTRTYLTTAFASGATNAGANIIDIGVCPTAGIAHITKNLGFDYGIVISASHNPKDYNGIKIFDSTGEKLGDEKEEELEKRFTNQITAKNDDIGKYSQNMKLTKIYEDHLINSCNTKLNDLTIVLDCSNGAAYKIAPKVFRNLAAKVITINSKNDGLHINDNCGSLYPDKLAKTVKKFGADMGFAFDGDADRIIACDEKGNCLDGDEILYILARHLKSENKLTNNTVVGTKQTNMGIEEALNKDGIKLIRTDIGDKFVIAQMKKLNLCLGGEKSGHIILKENSTTGDGILAGIKIAETIKKTNAKLSNLSSVDLYPQCNIDIEVLDKMKIINNEKLKQVIEYEKQILGEKSRILVRASGTESKIRIMTESMNENQAIISAKEIEKIVNKINNELIQRSKIN